MNWRRNMRVSLFVALCLFLVFTVERLARISAFSEGQYQAESALRQTVGALEDHISRFEALPALIARQSEVRDFLTSGASEGQISAMNLWLKETNQVIASSDLYLIALDGTTLAASNFDRADSFIGENFTYRPYFSDAAAGGLGRFFALGTTSGVRGYYFASPVRHEDGRIVGVVALKIGVDDLESAWQGLGHHTLVTDPEGIVFMSSDPIWRYRGLLPLTEDRMARTTASRRYSDLPLQSLDHVTMIDAGKEVIRLAGTTGETRDFLTVAKSMPNAGWTVHVLFDTAALRAQIRLRTAAAVLLLGVALSLAWALRQRKARLQERIALQVAAQAELERQVAERTADLQEANDELHRMQADLVQAGKLAALGRMSAALSHEINQPLAAARNYADSAALLIDRGDLPRAQENIGQILSLIDRMAAIARHLRNVARKPDEALHPVDLHAVVTDAVKLADTRLAASGVTVHMALPPGLPPVRGGPVRLQQVIVNLLTNAADAMEGMAAPVVEISARQEGGLVLLVLRDHGPGVPASIAERIMEPFYTTKAVGSGLGLGLSISYNILKDFGGDLRVSNHPEGGACFEVVLQVASARGMAAE